MGGSSVGGGPRGSDRPPPSPEMAQTPLEKNDRYYKNNTNKTAPHLYKWRLVTFVKTERNG